LRLASSGELGATQLAEYIERSGAKKRVEARIVALVADARRELAPVAMSAAARSVLEGAAAALAERES
jgi:hypothetical protein